MTREFRVRAKAQRDIQKAKEWYDDRRSGLGDRFLAHVAKTFKAIESSPLAFPEVERDVRRTVVKRFPYSVFYYVDDQLVSVLCVIHNRRDPRIWESRIASELNRQDDE